MIVRTISTDSRGTECLASRRTISASLCVIFRRRLSLFLLVTIAFHVIFLTIGSVFDNTFRPTFDRRSCYRRYSDLY